MNGRHPAIEAAGGGAVWLALAAWRAPGADAVAWSALLVPLAALVLLPLAWPLFGFGAGEEPGLKTAARLRLPAALALAAAYALDRGPLAAALTLPWLVWLGLAARAGFARIRREKWLRPLEGLGADLALGFALVGGLTATAERAGLGAAAWLAPLAWHFHGVGGLLPLVAGLVQRELFFLRLASRALVGAVLGVPTMALGMTVTHFGGRVGVEAGAGCGLALAGMAVAVLQVRLALDARKQAVRTRWLLGGGGTALFFGMVLTAAHALRGSALAAPWVSQPHVPLLQAALLALGFGLVGTLAWRSWR